MTHNEHHIIGPPGTGKTRTLVKNIQRAVDVHGPSNVLVASHTRAAAAELTARDVPVDEDMVGTLHALTWKRAGRPPIAETKFKEWSELHPSLGIKASSAELVDDLGGDMTPPTERGDELLQGINNKRSRLVPEELWSMEERSFWKKWRDWKMRSGYVDFTDLIENAAKRSEAPGNPKVVFIDEAQDMSALQFKLVRGWLDSVERAVLSGDDDQTIFGFSGADPSNLVNHAMPEANRIILNQSHRIPRTVHAAAQRLIERCSSRIPKEYKPREEEGAVTQMRNGDFKNPEPIIDLIEKKGRNGDTVMVLGSCGYMLYPIIAQMRALGIPFHNPYRSNNGGWNPMRSGEKSTVGRMKSFMKEGWTYFDLNQWTALVSSKHTMFDGAKKEIAARAAGKQEGALSDDDLARIFLPDHMPLVLQRDLSWLRKHALATKQKALGYPAKIAESRGHDALGDVPKVIVGTIHSVKGGEADHVVLLPDVSTAAAAMWQRGGVQRDSVLRTFYVGMTRARNTLTVAAPTSALFLPRLV